MPGEDDSYFFKTSDNLNLFVYDFKPCNDYKASIFIISSITGINHHVEKDIIDLLANDENRVIVMHPRGTGYSEGVRGDIQTIGSFIDDYTEMINSDDDYNSRKIPLYLFGHSMSCAVLLAIADKIDSIDGAILVKPPYLQKTAKGMSPTLCLYIKFAFFMLFARHKPIVNMAGNPSIIENEEDKMESDQRLSDPLLVKYFSLHYMIEARKLLKAMPGYAKNANYALLLLYGANDFIADKKGCDLIFKYWKNENKSYEIVANGTHGKSTVRLAANSIFKWIKKGNIKHGRKVLEGSFKTNETKY
ncbi:MAG: alpha/beta hydrolase [Bacteroidetes bacterium]|nr:alpha/beta hydrolase [Bacteroidota bacterium]